MAKSRLRIHNSIFCLFILLNAPSTEANQWSQPLTEKQLGWTIGGISTLIIGITIVYKLYHAYKSDEQFIKNCRSLYKNIQHNNQYYHNFYYYDAQLSDWELKDIIIKNSQDSYPFIAYQTALTKATWTLKKYLLELNNQLLAIERLLKNLRIDSENTDCLKENFLRLYTKGTNLQKETTKVITMIAILKKRIELFREYANDCHNWSQTEENYRYCKANLRLSSRSNERNASIISSRSPSIT